MEGDLVKRSKAGDCFFLFAAFVVGLTGSLGAGFVDVAVADYTSIYKPFYTDINELVDIDLLVQVVQVAQSLLSVWE